MKFGTLTQIGPYRGKIIKVFNLKKQDGAVVIFKTHTNPDITTRNGQIFEKFGMIMQNVSLKRQIVKKIKFPKSKMADGRHCENR